MAIWFLLNLDVPNKPKCIQKTISLYIGCLIDVLISAFVSEYMVLIFLLTKTILTFFSSLSVLLLNLFYKMWKELYGGIQTRTGITFLQVFYHLVTIFCFINWHFHNALDSSLPVWWAVTSIMQDIWSRGLYWHKKYTWLLLSCFRWLGIKCLLLVCCWDCINQIP